MLNLGDDRRREWAVLGLSIVTNGIVCVRAAIDAAPPKLRTLRFLVSGTAKATHFTQESKEFVKTSDKDKTLSTIIMEIGEAIENLAYRIFQTEYSGCLDISAHA